MKFSILPRNKFYSIIIPGSGSDSGTWLPIFSASCSIILSWFRLGFRGLSPYFFGILFHISWFRLGFRRFRLFHHHFLFPARVPGLVSIFFRHPACSIILSWFQLGIRGLSPYFFGILFHHPFLIPARVPGFVSPFFWHPVPSLFPGSG